MEVPASLRPEKEVSDTLE